MEKLTFNAELDLLVLLEQMKQQVSKNELAELKESAIDLFALLDNPSNWETSKTAEL